MYVTNAATNTVRVINANTTTNTYTAEASVTVGTTPRGIAVSPDGSSAYVANWGSNNVSVLNTSTATPTLVGSPITVGTNPDWGCRVAGRHPGLRGQLRLRQRVGAQPDGCRRRW